MRIALVGDIHANLPALESVVDHIDNNRVDTIWNLGDMVGYGPYPEEAINFLQNEFILSILGNYDRKVLRIKKLIKKWNNKKMPIKLLAFKWAFDQLSQGSKDYLMSLPEKIETNISGWNIYLTHGSPASREEHLTSETPESRLRQLSELAKADIIICGHSHQPFVRRTGNVWFINPGSVGRPDDGDYRASYAVLELNAHRVEVLHHRIVYDVDRAVRAVRCKGLPEKFAQMILLGHNLDTILAK
jgi:putative phosphoesterase